MNTTYYKAVFHFRYSFCRRAASGLRKLIFSGNGMSLGKGTYLSRISVTWPHQIKIGSHCLIEDDVYFKFDGPFQKGPSIVIGDHVFVGFGCEFNIKTRIKIGDDSLIASGAKFIDHDHGTLAAALMREQSGVENPIEIGSGCWIGVNAVILKGVTIGDGAIIAAGAIVTKSVPSLEIWAGVPAKRIGNRK